MKSEIRGDAHMTLKETVLTQLEDNTQNIITKRREFHEYPELSFQEKETSKKIKAFYEDLNMDVKPCGTGYGLIVDIDTGKKGKCIALRADFDALPVTESNGLPFQSKNKGVMHACGHDGHTAYLMYVAKVLNENKDQLTGKIRIIHQPAEELAPGGALSMIEDHCLDGVDHVLGLHVMTTMETGTIQYHQGETQTGRSNFSLTIKGAGGHASQPQLSNDAILAGSYFVNMIQSIVSRRLDPFSIGVITIGSFDGKGAANAINGCVTLEGDVRYYDEHSRKLIQKNITEMAKGLETAFEVKVELDYKDNYPVLYNDPDFTEYVQQTISNANISELKEVIDCGKQDPSEDFAYYAQKVPSCFIYAGCDVNDGKKHPHHSPDFLMDEDCLILAAKSVASVVVDYLKA